MRMLGIVNNARPGVSLVEVLLIITMMSIIIIPETMMMSQTMNASQGNYTQANRSNLANTLATQITPNRRDLATALDMAAQSNVVKEPNSTFTGSRNTIPFVTSQVAANSNALAKQYALYEYNNGAAISSPRVATLLYNSSDEVRIVFGTTIPRDDSSLRHWGASEGAYAANLKSYGWLTPAYVYTFPGYAVNVYSTIDQDLSLFRAQVWYPDAISYDTDVPNGPYTVQLWFNDECDNCARKLKITIEGQQMNTDLFDPRAIAGAINRQHMLSYDTYVWDGKLSVSIAEDSSNQTPEAICSRMAIIRRDLP
jgi:Tfp pilus assembly protein PilV